MKKLGLLLSVLILFSCNDTKEKELQLKEKELELKEKQLRLDSIKAVANTTLQETKVKDSVVKEESLKVKESNGVGIKKLKFPKGQLNSKYTYEFKCDDALWGKCILLIKEGNKTIQKHNIQNSASLIGNIQLIDNKFLYFHSEIFGGTAGNHLYYHYLIDLTNRQVYRRDMDCYEEDHTECQLKQPLSIKVPAFRYYEESEDY